MAVRCSMILYCMMLYDAVWCFMMLYDAVWCCMMLHQYLYDAVWCCISICMMLYDAVWCCISICMMLYQYLYDAVWCCMMLYDAVWCCISICMMLYDAVWCCISICMMLYQYLYDAVSVSVWVSYPHWAVGFWPPCPKCHALNAMLEGTSAKTTKQVSHGLTVGAHESIHQENRESQEQNSCCSCLQRVLNAITYEQMTKQYDTIRYILQIITT